MYFLNTCWSYLSNSSLNAPEICEIVFLDMLVTHNLVGKGDKLESSYRQKHLWTHIYLSRSSWPGWQGARVGGVRSTHCESTLDIPGMSEDCQIRPDGIEAFLCWIRPGWEPAAGAQSRGDSGQRWASRARLSVSAGRGTETLHRASTGSRRPLSSA